MSASSPYAPSVRLITVDVASEGQRLDNFLLRCCKGVPKSHIYKAIRSGQVRVNKGRSQADYRLQAGDQVRVPPLRLPSAPISPVVPKAQFEFIYEDEHLLVVNKPAGLAVHGGSGVAFGLIEQLRISRPDCPFLELAHRLDRETSGLLIVAKTRKALVALHEMMRQSAAQKSYLALVVGCWPQAQCDIKLPLLKYLTADGERRVRVDTRAGKYAHTQVQRRQQLPAHTLLQATLRTGRTHQIRVHLASSGFPIVGDDKYGSDDVRNDMNKRGFKRMFLHAHRLRFRHPITQVPIQLEAPLPAACVHILEALS